MKNKDIAPIDKNTTNVSLKQKRIIYISASVLVIMIAAIFMIRAYVSSQVDKATVKATAFLEDLDNKNYASAYSLLASDQQQTGDQEMFQFNNEINRNSLGNHISRSVKSSKAKLVRGKLEITVTFNSQFQSDSIAEEIVAVNSNFFSTNYKVGEYRTISEKIIKY